MEWYGWEREKGGWRGKLGMERYGVIWVGG
jgi:hypothetical protein